MEKPKILLPFANQLHQNLKNNTPFIQVLLGPRQVGKTTTVLHMFNKHYNKSEYKYYSADKVYNNHHAWIQEVWNTCVLNRNILIIDEIQKIENWTEVIKTLWDNNKVNNTNLKVVLLGSSSLDLHIGLTESLTGRFQILYAYPWNFQESKLGYQLEFDEYLKFGGYPGSYSLKNDLLSWSDYIKNSILNTVIEKDILLSNKVKSPALFRQSFDLLMSYPAQEISYTKLLGQLQDKGNTDLIKSYIKLFEGAFLIKTLHKFSLNKLKLKTSSPKILPLSPCYQFLELLSEYRPEEKGRAFEVIVGCTLNRLGFELSYWREGPHEVDYILKFGRKIWAIEVKSGRTKKTSGLHEFCKHYPQAIPIIINKENYFQLEDNPLKFLGLKE